MQAEKIVAPFVRLLGKRLLTYVLEYLAFSLLAAYLMYEAYNVSPPTTLRILFGLAYVMFLPGYLLCWLFFPDDSEVSEVERAGLSFGLSIPLTMSAVLASNVIFKTALTSENIVKTIGLLLISMLAAGAIRYALIRRTQKK